MDALPVINVFAVHYKGTLIEGVKAAVEAGDGVSNYRELCREEMLGEMERGVALQAVDVTHERKVLLGRISLLQIDNTRYFTLNNVPIELDDLGDLQQY